MTNQISAQENVEVTDTKQQLKQVEQEIVELKSKNEDLKQLLQTQDDIIFLQVTYMLLIVLPLEEHNLCLEFILFFSFFLLVEFPGFPRS